MLKLFKKINNTKRNIQSLSNKSKNDVLSCYDDFKGCLEDELTIQNNITKTVYIYTYGKNV
jgi:superfamily II helicase